MLTTTGGDKIDCQSVVTLCKVNVGCASGCYYVAWQVLGQGINCHTISAGVKKTITLYLCSITINVISKEISTH